MKFPALSLLLFAASAAAQGGKKSGPGGPDSISLSGGKKGMSMTPAPSVSLAPSASPTFARTDTRATFTGEFIGGDATPTTTLETCPEGELAVGFSSKVNSRIIVGLALKCAPVSFEEMQTALGVVVLPDVDESGIADGTRIGAGGADVDRLCPDDAYLTGFRVTMEIQGNNMPDPNNINVLQGVCSNGQTDVSPNAPKSNNRGTNEFYCPPGMAITGVQGAVQSGDLSALAFQCSVPDEFAAP